MEGNSVELISVEAGLVRSEVSRVGDEFWN